jgi:hypothetical protein
MKFLPEYIKKRIGKNQNFVMLFVGQTGTGKSYASMSLAEALDPDFNINRIVFSADEFITVLKTDETLRSGSVIMWDEAGVGMPAREWYSLSNKIISYVVQTFRVKGYVLLMTTPSLRYIDSQIRQLFHGVAETIDPSVYGGTFGWAKYMHLVHDPKEGKTKMQYPIIKDDQERSMKVKGRRSKSGNILFPIPSQELLADYEKKKKTFTDELINSASEMMEGKEDEKNEDDVFTVERIKNTVLSDPKKWGIEYLQSKGTWENHVYAIIREEYPEVKIAKGDISAALHLIRHKVDNGELNIDDHIDMIEARKAKYTGGKEPRFTESDVQRVYDTIKANGFNKSATILEVSKSTLVNFRTRMKKEGKWPIDIEKKTDVQVPAAAL